MNDEIAAVGRFRVGTGETLDIRCAVDPAGRLRRGDRGDGRDPYARVGRRVHRSRPDPEGPIARRRLTVRLVPGAKLFNRAGEALDRATSGPATACASSAPSRERNNTPRREPRIRARARGSRAATRNGDAAVRRRIRHARDPGRDAGGVGPACVAIGSGDDVFRIIDRGDQLHSDRIAPGDLQVGEVVDVFGHPADPVLRRRHADLVRRRSAASAQLRCRRGLTPSRGSSRIASAGVRAGRADVDLGGLARCISDRGAIFYGAHWCPVCRSRRSTSTDTAYLLPYVECYDGDKSDGTNDRCKDRASKSFPTWKFPDGSVKTGAQKPEALAAATGCPFGRSRTTRGAPTRGGEDGGDSGGEAAPDRGY